jgi:hypothetical protein
VQERQHAFKSLGLVFGLIALFLAIGHWKAEPQRWDDWQVRLRSAFVGAGPSGVVGMCPAVRGQRRVCGGLISGCGSASLHDGRAVAVPGSRANGCCLKQQYQNAARLRVFLTSNKA